MLVFELSLFVSCADDVRVIADPDSNAESWYISMRSSRAVFCLALAKAGLCSPQGIVFAAPSSANIFLRIVCDSLDSESPAAALFHEPW